MLNFLKLNIRYLVVGLFLIILGYIIMAWDIPNVTGGANVYAWHKLTLAPIILVLGYITIGISIMVKSSK